MGISRDSGREDKNLVWTCICDFRLGILDLVLSFGTDKGDNWCDLDRTGIATFSTAVSVSIQGYNEANADGP